MAKDKRVEVLFEPNEYRTLEDAAHREGKSVGHVIREAVAKYVTGPTQEDRRKAWERIMAMEDDLPAMDPAELSEYMARLQYEADTAGLYDDEDGPG